MTKFNQLIFRFDSIQHQFYDKYVFCPTKYIDIFAPILTIFREQFIHNIWNFCCNFDVISIRIIIHCCKLLICFRQFELKVIKFDNRIDKFLYNFEDVFENQKTEWLKIPNIKLFILQQFIIFPPGKCSKSNHLNFFSSLLKNDTLNTLIR